MSAPTKARASLHQLPEGLRDFLPREAMRLRLAESLILDRFETWGYAPLITPGFEYLDNFMAGDPQWSAEDFLKLEDRASGRLLAGRADFTPQVARIASTLLKDAPLPLRLAYSGPVLRHRSDADRELRQAGVELIGASGVEADTELMAMAAESLVLLGLSPLTLDIHHPGLFQQLMAAGNVPREAQREARELLHRKDPGGLARWADGQKLDSALREAVAALATHFGDPRCLKDIRKAVDGIKALDATHRKAMTTALDDIESVVDRLGDHGLEIEISVDLGELSSFEYHTGTAFSVYHPASPLPLAGGGRYDALMNAFGLPRPASGFAVDLEAASRLSPILPDGPRLDFVLHLASSTVATRALAARAASELRDLGLAVHRNLDGDSVEAAQRYAEATGTAAVLVIAPDAKNPALIRIIGLSEEIPSHEAELDEWIKDLRANMEAEESHVHGPDCDHDHDEDEAEEDLAPPSPRKRKN